jgi:hypothetical protein
MGKKNNFVLAGDYENCRILASGQFKGRKKILHVPMDPNQSENVFLQAYSSKSQFVEISKETIESWQLVTEETQKSLSSSLARGLVGGALLGPLGLIAGGVTGKNRKTYHVLVNWNDGKKSLFELNDFWYKEYLKAMI